MTGLENVSGVGEGAYGEVGNTKVCFGSAQNRIFRHIHHHSLPFSFFCFSPLSGFCQFKTVAV